MEPCFFAHSDDSSHAEGTLYFKGYFICRKCVGEMFVTVGDRLKDGDDL
jgi:hypothetical protein